jgi:hypothetical protein
MTTYDLANERITEDIANNKIDDTTDNTNANNYAKNIMKSYEEQENELQNSSSQYRQAQHPEPSMYQAPQPPQSSQQPQQPQQPHQPQQQRPEQPMPHQYQPPVPPQTQPPIPQQSQYMNVNQTLPASPANGEYTGFDTSDNLSPLDSAFNNTIKEAMRTPANVNSAPKMNDNVSPYSASNVDNFSLF